MELNEARNMDKGAARGKKKSTSKSKEEDKGGREEHWDQNNIEDESLAFLVDT